MSGLYLEILVLSAGPVGIMQACLDVVLPYIRERSQFGRPIGEFQFIQGKVADMYTSLQSSRSFASCMNISQPGQYHHYILDGEKGCESYGFLGLSNRHRAGAILSAAERDTQVALQAIQCLGGNGYVNEYTSGRLLRDAKLYEIGAGTSEIRRMVNGRELFKEQ
ncbi:isovaleryl-CoA dehydrogenase, mitochondrial-like [Hibiscus syriacus]|uniref:isovaleryl-CoA dehydrogenase, mitochondrial-like n=1 Tax=Hibiscus syriacus TaxID=106335 RepID=UPI0019243AA0|nr:isovaleryl-CoA dehydrogenase, mitochondrial-like [Hibiscus syriacus]